MIRPHPTLIAKTLAGFIVCLAMCLFVNAESAECETYVHIRKKFIPKPYDWKSVERVAILPVEHLYRTETALRTLRKSSHGRDFPADSALRPLLTELRRHIQLLDSSIMVLTIGKPTFQLPDSALGKLAGNISRADVVLSVKVTEVDYNEATTEIPIGSATGATLPPIGAKPASTRAQMTFTMKDVKYGEIIWQIDAKGKMIPDVAVEESTKSDPPQLEDLLKEIIITAGSWFPFGVVDSSNTSEAAQRP